MRYKCSSLKAIRGALGILLSLGLVLSSCEQEAGNTDALRTVCFDTEVLPLFQSACATTDCHDAAAEGGYQLDSYESIREGISSRDIYKSKIYTTIISSSEDRMPPDSVMPIEQRMLIRVWIEQGAANIICTEQPLPDPDPDTIIPPYSNPYVCFERDILPVMQSSCGITACHDPYTMVEEFNFTTYQGILDGLVPGNPEISKIYKSINEDEPSDIMPPPPYEALSMAQIDSVYAWILKGAPDEFCGDICDTAVISYNTHLEVIIDSRCKSCHSGGSPQGGVPLTTYDDLKAAAAAGSFPAVLRAADGYSLMPPSGAMSECEIRAFELWIEDGMPL